MEGFLVAFIWKEALQHVALDPNIVTGGAASLLNIFVILEGTVLRHLSIGERVLDRWALDRCALKTI